MNFYQVPKPVIKEAEAVPPSAKPVQSPQVVKIIYCEMQSDHPFAWPTPAREEILEISSQEQLDKYIMAQTDWYGNHFEKADDFAKKMGFEYASAQGGVRLEFPNIKKLSETKKTFALIQKANQLDEQGRYDEADRIDFMLHEGSWSRSLRKGKAELRDVKPVKETDFGGGLRSMPSDDDLQNYVVTFKYPDGTTEKWVVVLHRKEGTLGAHDQGLYGHIPGDIKSKLEDMFHAKFRMTIGDRVPFGEGEPPSFTELEEAKEEESEMGPETCGQCGKDVTDDIEHGDDWDIAVGKGDHQTWCNHCWENFADKCGDCGTWYDYTLDECPECESERVHGGSFKGNKPSADEDEE